ncbi:MAG: PRC-barrel domain-containing protein [Caldimonas sp.]
MEIMLRSAKDLEGFAVGATDGVIGHVKDLNFDDEAWVVRYLVVDAGGWLSSRKVLISPIAIGAASPALRERAGFQDGQVDHGDRVRA